MHWKAFALWLLALIPLLIALDGPPVQRAQEGRVVETARQMLRHGPEAWLIPSLNGEIRLRKPPLAYWMAATSFSILGVSDWSARLPTALISWLTVGATYAIARRRFGATAGVLSAACLLSSYLFFRYGRLAETDAPAAFFATVAVHYFWRALDENRAILFHAAAAAVGMSLFAKQGPGFFPLIFFVSLSLMRRKPRAIWRFVKCGAPVTLIVLAGWWYGYAAMTRGIAQFSRELAEVTEGIDHPAPFYVYFPMILLAAGPSWLLMIGALVAAVRRRRDDPNLVALLVWAASCFLPLCFVGNKQEHYLLPLMPPLMILVGWLVSLAGRPDSDARLVGAMRVLMVITIITSIGAAVGIPVVAYHFHGGISDLDAVLAGWIGVFSILAWILLYKRSIILPVLTLSLAWMLAFPILLGVWGRTFDPVDIRPIAMAIRQRFSGPFVFYGGDTSFPLCFALRQEIGRIDDKRPDLLRAAAERDPHLAVIWEVPQHGAGANLPPAGFVQVGPDYGARGQHFRIYQLRSGGAGNSQEQQTIGFGLVRTQALAGGENLRSA